MNSKRCRNDRTSHADHEGRNIRQLYSTLAYSSGARAAFKIEGKSVQMIYSTPLYK